MKILNYFTAPLPVKRPPTVSFAVQETAGRFTRIVGRYHPTPAQAEAALPHRFNPYQRRVVRIFTVHP